MSAINKVVLAYSGGLDTSVILKWLQDTYKCEIVTFTADSLGYSPDPPVYYGAIDFEGGGRMVTEFAEVTAADVEVGREMRMVFRIKAVDDLRDFTKYFWKAVPVSRGDS